MKSSGFIVLCACCIASAAFADDIPDMPAPWEWSLSTSDLTPHEIKAPPANGVRDLFLWFTHHENKDVQSARIDLFTTEAITVRSVTGANGTILHAAAADPLSFIIESPSCLSERKVVAIVTIEDHGGQVCFAELPWSTCSAKCGGVGMFQSSFSGFSSTENLACRRLLELTEVPCPDPPADNSRTWGLLKVSYRE